MNSLSDASNRGQVTDRSRPGPSRRPASLELSLHHWAGRILCKMDFDDDELARLVDI